MTGFPWVRRRLAGIPDPDRESRWLAAFESLELLEPVVMLLEAVCGLFDI